jgi:hypothetical protein
MEQEDFRRFLAGEPLTEPPDLDWFRPWLDQIREVTSQGRAVQRIRILADPPTDYQRWELWATPYNAAAGEDIRFLTRSQATELGLPSGDWWLFDDTRLAVMRFDDEGRPLGGTIVTDPDVVARHRHWRDVAITHSIRYDELHAR